MSKFKDTFDVGQICYDLIQRIKEPAVSGKIYDIECTKAERKDGVISFEFRTSENKYIDIKFNLLSAFDRTLDFINSLCIDLDNIDTVKNKRYNAFYKDEWNLIILKSLG